MSRIRSRGTQIELKVKKALEEQGIDFEYQPRMFGNPDFLIRQNIVVFCDSSFWHGRNWNRLKKKLPNQYWRTHIGQNRKRDRLVNARLRTEGHVVLRFWDYQIEKHMDNCIRKIRETLEDRVSGEISLGRTRIP